MKKLRIFAIIQKIKNNYISLICLIFILLLFLFASDTMVAGKRALYLWLEVVIPSLFPFLVASRILVETDFAKKLGKYLESYMRPVFNLPGCAAIAIFLGVFSGYPVGAKVTSDLRKRELINRYEAERLIAFSNNSGPIFISGAVAGGILQRYDLGTMLILSHVTAALIIGVLLKHILPSTSYQDTKYRYNKEKNSIIALASHPARNNAMMSPVKIATHAVKESVVVILNIGGYIILFSVISAALAKTGVTTGLEEFLNLVVKTQEGVMTGLFYGFLEITNGISLLSQVNISLSFKLTLTSLLLGWGGLSVHAQTAEIISGTDIKLKTYILGKFLQGIISSVITLLYCHTIGG